MSVNKQSFDVVTGAFGYTGRYIAKRLVAQGHTVATLTRRTQPAGLFPQPLQRIVPNYADRDALAAQLQGADTLYNTYWVRFDHGGTGHEAAVEHSRTLFAAARMAGVSKIVHVSIAHADSRSPLPYYRGKGQVEEALRGEGVPYVIIRPTLVFGREDILVNNIAWFLRRFPLFGLPGSGDYGVRPVFVEDVADLALRTDLADANAIVDAVGPEKYTFRELVALVASGVGEARGLVGLPPRVALAATALVGLLVRDVVLTEDEVRGLMAGLLTTDGAASGETRFSEWLKENTSWLGKEYRSELGAHFR